MDCLILPPLQALRRPKIASDSPKMATRRRKDGFLVTQDGPKIPQDGLKTVPTWLQDAVWTRSVIFSGAFLEAPTCPKRPMRPA